MTYESIVKELHVMLGILDAKHPDITPMIFFEPCSRLYFDGSTTITYRICIVTSASTLYSATHDDPGVALDELWRWLNKHASHDDTHIQNLGELPVTKGVADNG